MVLRPYNGKDFTMAVVVNGVDSSAYSGLPTFCKVPLARERSDLAAADVVVVGAPFDARVTNRSGARMGPRAIRAACPVSLPPARPHVVLGVDAIADLQVVDYGDVAPSPGDLSAELPALQARVAEVLNAGAAPAILGGDHSIAYATLSAVGSHYGPGGVAIVQFDTHTDTGDEDGRLTHGTPMRLVIDEGAISGAHFFQVGLRGYWPFPDVFAWMRDVGMRWFTIDDVDERGIKAVVAEMVAAIRAAGVPVYLSVDVDVLDPSAAPGTGTPEPGGLSSRELLYAVRELTRRLPFAGIEVVEVCPPYDEADITALVAHRCILEALAGHVVYRNG